MEEQFEKLGILFLNGKRRERERGNVKNRASNWKREQKVNGEFLGFLELKKRNEGERKLKLNG